MRNLDQTTITESALERLAKCPDPRLKEVMTALIRHVHEFAREVKLTPAEWTRGIEFLTDVGHITDDKRQEFILLSDTLGLSALVSVKTPESAQFLFTSQSDGRSPPPGGAYPLLPSCE